MINDHLILIAGKSATGKSASLMNITNPEGVMYLNCEVGKKLPFASKFLEKIVIDPNQIYGAFDAAEALPDIHTIVIDSMTFMMDMYETIHVLTSNNTMQAWGDYAQFFKKLMSQYVAKSTKNVIIIGHTLDILNEQKMEMETFVKVKGSLMNNGIESFFSNVIACKKEPEKKLEAYGSPLLTFSDEEKLLGFKYCFQTRLTKETVNERIRSPLNMWSTAETYVNNDIQQVIDRLHSYYK